MMRQVLKQQPLLGWVVALVLCALAGYFAYRNFSGGETAELTQMVTIRCTETGETWKIPRGVMEKELYMRSYPVDPTQGLVNPKTGKATGFPVDDWKLTVERINSERKELAESRNTPPTGGAPGRQPGN